jgi:SnoaL-like domain
VLGRIGVSRSFLREENPMQEIIERYIAAWNETDPAARRGLVDALWAADGSYTDPLAEVHGPAEIDGLIGAVQQQFPDFVFTLGGPVDANHNQARFTWHLGPEGAGAPPVIGFDVVVLDENGQIRSVHGFLDKVPAAA